MSVLLVEKGIDDNGPPCVNHIQQLIQIHVEKHHSWEIRKPSIEDNTAHVEPVFEEAVVYQLAVFPVPLSSVVEG